MGDDHEPRAFAIYSACAIALIGRLPDTLNDRSAHVELKRRLPSEQAEPFRPDRADHLDELARKAVRWTKDNAVRVGEADPEMPDGIINRAADNLRPLLAIADAAGGEWPQRARKAAEASRSADDHDASRLELLLGDIRDVFKEIEMSSAELVKALVAIEGRPWAELGKSRKPLTQNGLARMLKTLGIGPDKIGPETKRLNGYKRDWFKDAFARFLPPQGASEPDIRTERDEMGTSDDFKMDSHEPGCPVEKCEKPNNDGVLSTCPVAKGFAGEKAKVTAANCSAEPGLSRRRVQELADWYSDEGHQRYCDNTLDTAALDAELRTALAEEVFPRRDRVRARHEGGVCDVGAQDGSHREKKSYLTADNQMTRKPNLAPNVQIESSGRASNGTGNN